MENKKELTYLSCCQSACVDISSTVALILLIINCFFPGFGTQISGYIDRQGCNFTALFVGLAQGLLACIIIGWVWGIVHMCKVWNWAKNNEK